MESTNNVPSDEEVARVNEQLEVLRYRTKCAQAQWFYAALQKQSTVEHEPELAKCMVELQQLRANTNPDLFRRCAEEFGVDVEAL